MEPKPGSANTASSDSSTVQESPEQRRAEEEFETGDPSHDSYNQATLEAIGGPITKKVSVNNVASIPNGGIVAWLQVLGSFILSFNSWGIVNTFGVYQTYYESHVLSHEAPSTIAWIGSIQGFLLMLVGALTGPIYDAGYFRALLLTGSFLVVFGHMMLSICTTYWQVLLAQAFCIGLGFGCLFVPSVAILSTYFTTKIAFANGVAAAGSSMGGVIYPIMLHKLIPRIGFSWSVRVVGFVALATQLVAITVMRVRVKPGSRRKLVDWAAFKDPAYTLFILGGFVSFLGLYVPFFYIQIYAISHNITDSNMAFYLLAILNGASTFGRIVPNFLADKTGPFNMIVPCAIITGIISQCFIPVSSLASLIVCCALYGFFSGSFVSLPPSVLVHLSPNRGMIGTRMGMCFTIVSFGVLIGTPIGGAIMSSSGFTGAWIFGGVATAAGGSLMAAGRVCKAGWSLKVWV